MRRDLFSGSQPGVSKAQRPAHGHGMAPVAAPWQRTKVRTLPFEGSLGALDLWHRRRREQCLRRQTQGGVAHQSESRAGLRVEGMTWRSHTRHVMSVNLISPIPHVITCATTYVEIRCVWHAMALKIADPVRSGISRDCGS